MNEVTFTLTFSDEDFDTLDHAARVMKMTRDELLKMLLAEGIAQGLKETIRQFRVLIADIQDRNLARVAGVSVSDAKRVRMILNGVFGKRA
jgi:hypothetical protein